MTQPRTRPRPGTGNGTAQKDSNEKATHTPTSGWEWVQWAREQKVHPPAARHLLLLLATYADRRGECWPGMVTLSRVMGLSERRVRALAEVLIEHRLLHVEHTPRKPNGRRCPNRYRLMPDRGS